MRIPLTWLRSFCDPGLDAAALGERLDLTGTELERIEHAGVPDPANFVVGKVLSAEKHPDADRLKVCEVDTADAGGPRTIVCGAPNVAAGQTVAVALPGAVMPDGTELGEAKLRGVKSSGMILAEDEIGIGTDHAGTMVLAGDIAAGTALADVLPIADDVLDVEITPNRPDCLCVYGVAREVHAATGAPLAPDPTTEDAEPAGTDQATDHASVEIADPDICLRFTARVFEDVKIGPSPVWLKQRLSAAGQRPISNVVDITNYVLLEYGQPLHAFDLDEVRGQQDRRPAGQAGGEDDHARRRRADVRRVDGRGLRRRGPVGHRWSHGRPDLGGLREDHARADGGGDVGRPEHPGDLEGARPAQ